MAIRSLTPRPSKQCLTSPGATTRTPKPAPEPDCALFSCSSAILWERGCKIGTSWEIDHLCEISTLPHMCRFSAAGMMLYLRAEAAGGRKAPRHEVAGSWAVASSECYGDLMSTPSLDGWRDANTTRPSCLPHGRWAECSRHLGGCLDRLNARSVH